MVRPRPSAGGAFQLRERAFGALKLTLRACAEREQTALAIDVRLREQELRAPVRRVGFGGHGLRGAQGGFRRTHRIRLELTGGDPLPQIPERVFLIGHARLFVSGPGPRRGEHGGLGFHAGEDARLEELLPALFLALGAIDFRFRAIDIDCRLGRKRENGKLLSGQHVAQVLFKKSGATLGRFSGLAAREIVFRSRRSRAEGEGNQDRQARTRVHEPKVNAGLVPGRVLVCTGEWWAIRCAAMCRIILAAALFSALRLPAAESMAARVDAEYRAKRQAALSAQWMEMKMPFETPAAYLARLIDTAREGDSRATAALGWEFHQRGDILRSRSWLGRSAERGNPFAAYLLGAIKPPPDSPSEADSLTIDWMRRAADDGLADAQFEMALRHAQARGAPLDLAEARRWYERAAEQNYAPALCNLATMEWQGSGGAADLAKAEQHFRGAADAGFPQGFFGMGEVLRVQERYAEAGPAYVQAAEAGIAEADFWLGCLASQGLGQARDERNAAKHFLKAALAGHIISQAIAADVLARGAGITADPDAAARWDVEMKKVTDRELITTLGGLYLEGRLVKRDLVKALQYFRTAAAQGQPAAQRWAGALLASGEAGERDLMEAYQWLWLAARKGQADAEPAFQAVLRAMDGNQIIEAAKRAEQFQPAPPAAEKKK